MMKNEKIEKVLYYIIIIFLMVVIATAAIYMFIPFKPLLYTLFVGNIIVCLFVLVQYSISRKANEEHLNNIVHTINSVHRKIIGDVIELAQTKVNDMENFVFDKEIPSIAKELDHSIKHMITNGIPDGNINAMVESYGNKYKELINGLINIIYEYHKKVTSLYLQLDTLCPVHLPLDLVQEWNDFIDSRFDSSFELIKDSIRLLQKIQAESMEYVQYVLEILKGFKDKRTVQYEEMLGFYAKMRNTQESFAQYLSTVSQTFQFIKEIMIQVEEITDKINILSLNMSIEANKLTGNNVFSIIAKELHAFSEQTIKYFDPMKKTIEQNLSIIEEKKKEEQDAIEQIQEFINLSEKMIKEYEDNINQFTKLVDNVSKILIKQDDDVKGNLFQQFEDMQKLVIIKEEISHRDMFYQIMLKKVNTTIQQLIRDHKICSGIDCEYRIDSFKILEGLITTADEREFLKKLYKKYLNRELEEDQHKKGDVILF